VSLLRRELSGVRGVFDLVFDVLQARMRVEYDDAMTSPAAITRAVAATGMKAEPWGAQREPEAAGPRRTLTMVSGIALAVGWIVEGASGDGLWRAILAHDAGEHDLPAAAVAGFAVAVAAGLALVIPKAAAAARHLRPDMNVLVCVSVAGAALLEEWSEAATVAFLFSLAGQLESSSLERARHAIRRLLGQPAGGHLHPGQSVTITAGQRIPADGIVETGESTVDQALLTGESVAVPKRAGDSLFAGTMNIEAPLTMRVTQAAADSTLARTLRMVADSQARRAPAERFIERFARWYTPAMLLLAVAVSLAGPLLSGQGWQYWLYQGLVILLIACPCALVISTPVTIAAALASAARAGVLIKGGAFLEQAAGPQPPAIVANAEDLDTAGHAVLRVAPAGRASDLAIEAADVVLLPGNTAQVDFLTAHAQRALGVVRQNVAFALGAKALFLALAFLGAATLWMAVAADMGATLLVTANGLRMLRAKSTTFNHP
jgi:Cd2+/Zn2+-exporting ATPase